MGWYNASWQYRQKITVDNTKVSATLSDFPVYLDLSQLSSGFFTHVNSDGSDIRITTSDGETEVPREVVSINTGSSVGEVHFKASSLASATDTDFYIYYGNSGASEPASNATYGSENVWNSSYISVHHLGAQTPDGTAGGIKDSTSNSHDGTAHGNMGVGNIVAGKFGKALSFDGTDDYISVPDNSAYDFNNVDFSFSFWAKPTTDTGGPIWKKGNNTTTALGWGLYWNTSTAGWARFNDGSNDVYINVSHEDATWHQRHITFDASGDATSYKNASVETSADNPKDCSSIGNMGNSYDLWFMKNFSSAYTEGVLAEVRILNTVLSSTWISTEYNNQNSPSTFYSVGSEETNSTPSTPADDAVFFGMNF